MIRDLLRSWFPPLFSIPLTKHGCLILLMFHHLKRSWISKSNLCHEDPKIPTAVHIRSPGSAVRPFPLPTLTRLQRKWPLPGVSYQGSRLSRFAVDGTFPKVWAPRHVTHIHTQWYSNTVTAMPHDSLKPKWGKQKKTRNTTALPPFKPVLLDHE